MYVSNQLRFWLQFANHHSSRPLDHVGCWKVGYATRGVTHRITVEVSEATYREHYAFHFDRFPDDDERNAYWQLLADWWLAGGGRSVRAWITDGDGIHVDQSDVDAWLLRDERALDPGNAPTLTIIRSIHRIGT